MSLYLVTPPTAEPITLAEAKKQCRVDHDTDDEYISGLITSVRMHLEGRDGWFGRVLATSTWDYKLDSFPGVGAALELPLPPLASVTSITFKDPDGAPLTLSSLAYTVAGIGGFEKGTVSEAFGFSWPGTDGTSGNVVVRFVAGYGSPLAVPAPIRAAMLILVEDLYDRPTDSTLRDRAYILLAPLRLQSL